MKSILPMLLSILIYSNLQSQSIKNTKWQTYNPSLSDTVTVEVKVDTIHQYIDADTILVSSLFTEMNDTISLIDVSGPFACPVTDTGWYSYSIVNDSLTISLLTDPCFTRSITYNGVVLWRIDKPSGLNKSLDNSIEVKLFPNPSYGKSTFTAQESGQLLIYSASGQLVVNREILEANEVYDISLNAGTYIVSFLTKEKRINKKLLVY